MACNCNDCLDNCSCCEDIAINGSTCDKLNAYNDEDLHPLAMLFQYVDDPCKWQPILKKLVDNLWCLNANEIKVLCNLLDRMNKMEDCCDEVKDMIDDLQDQIDGLMGLNWITLKKGTDYDIKFYNGWYNNDMDFNVRVSPNKQMTSVKVSVAASDTAKQLKNDNLNNTMFNHGADKSTEDWLKSRVVEVTFKGKYAPLNGGAKYNTINTAILNVRPFETRASWTATCVAYTMDDQSQMFTIGSYSDGYNNQWSVYNEPTLNSPFSNYSSQWTTTRTVV